MPTTPDRQNVLLEFADFLVPRRNDILHLWLQSVRTDPSLPTSQTLTDVEILNHMPELFAALINALRGKPVVEAVAKIAHTHGSYRLGQGYSLVEVYRELSLFRQLLFSQALHLYQNSHQNLPLTSSQALTDLLLAFTAEAITGSLERFTTQQSKDRTQAEIQVRENDRVITEAMRLDRNRLAAFLHALPTFIAILRGPDYVFETANSKYLELIGQRDIIGRPVSQVLPEAKEQGFLKILDQVYSSGLPYSGKDVLYRVPSRENHPAYDRFIDFVFVPTLSPSGIVDGVFVHGVDVTEATLVRQDLIRIADSIPQIAWTARGDGTVDYFNQQWYDFTGQDPEQGIVWGPAIYPADLEPLVKSWGEAVRTGRNYEFRYRLVRSDGQARWQLSRALPARNEFGQVTRWFGTITDIHDAKQAEDEMRLAQAEREQLLSAERAARTEAEQQGRMKDEFLATLSHELRTPLNAILGWSQLLRDTDLNDTEEVRMGLATIERNALAQTQIIEDLLDMSRIISGKVLLQVESIDLVEIVKAAVETVRHAAEAKHIQMHTEWKLPSARIHGDINRLQQVFWNLLSNAIKFTPKSGRVDIILSGAPSHYHVSIIDSGPGIAAEFLPYVFDRFRQADASTTRRHGGLGLGLAIVKQLTELHGGSVQVHSAGLNQGTTFGVTLPSWEADSKTPLSNEHPVLPEQHALTLSPEPSVAVNLQGVRVLVVDDEEDARLLVQRILQDRSALVRTADSVQQAWDMFQQEPPDVLVSDVGMPNEDGFTLIRRIRALPATSGGAVPAVALTAYARAEDRLKVLMSGFQMHLSKPLNSAELLAIVANLTGRYQQPQPLS